MLLVLSGCNTNNGDGFLVYYINENGTGLYPVSEKIESDDADYMARALLDKLSGVVEDQDYYAPIVGDLKVENYILEDGCLSVYFSHEYQDLSPTYEALLRASVVQTMLQVEGINEVAFYSDNEPVTDASGVPIGHMNSDSFIYDYGQAFRQSETATVSLYYASPDGNYLVKVNRTVHYNITQQLEQVIIQRLCDKPESEDYMSAIPEGVNVLSVVTSEGTCYLTLDANFLNSFEGVSKEVSVYSIVNSLCALDSIDHVQIIIETTNPAMAAADTISGTYEANDEIVTLE